MMKPWLIAPGACLVLAIAASVSGEPSAGDAKAGEALYQDRCALCHLAEGGGEGPTLRGVYGRPAAAVAGFTYTDALKASKLSWTGPNLDRFLADPAKAVPGTGMPISVPDAKERADLIAYFASAPAR